MSCWPSLELAKAIASGWAKEQEVVELASASLGRVQKHSGGWFGRSDGIFETRGGGVSCPT